LNNVLPKALRELNPDLLQQQLTKELFKKSYYEFFKAAFPVLLPGDQYQDNFHIKYLCNLLQAEGERIIENKPKGKDYIINIPPRTSKSLICSVIFPVWCWIRKPSLKIITVSYNTDIATSNSYDSRTLIESDFFQTLFGNEFQIKQDQNSKSDYQNNKSGFRKAVGTGGGITGKGGDIIILDDPESPSMADSANLRKVTQDYYSKTLYNRLNNVQTGIRIIIQQRLHESDLTGHLLETNRDDYNHVCLPAQLQDNVSPKKLSKYYKDNVLDPNRLPQNELQKIKRSLGTLAYSGQYLQSPSPSEGMIFKRNWFKTISLTEFIQRLDGRGYTVNYTVDAAYTADKNNDPTAILAYTQVDKTIYVFNCQTVWLEFTELKDYIRKFCLENSYTSNSRLYIEGAGPGKSLISELQRPDNEGNRLNAVEIIKPRKDKVSRAISQTAKVESNGIVLIQGKYIDNFLNEVCSFPRARHDDMVDVMLFALDKGSSTGVWDFRFS
jgi:predicted phage terminase large subunit-like protein